MSKQHIGTTFDSFLKEEGILEDIEAKALKHTIALLIEQKLEEEGINKTDLARRLHTSRSAVNRLLDPENTSVTLRSIVKVTSALGKKLQIRTY